MDKSLRVRDYFLKVDKNVVIDTNGEISANLLRKGFKFSFTGTSFWDGVTSL